MSFSSPVHRSSVAIALCAVALFALPARPVAAQEEKPFEAYSVSAQTLRDSIVSLARAQIGTRYRTGGESPNKGFDCSGLVQYVMAALNLNVPRTARQQAKTGLAVSRDTSRLLPGDLLTFGKGKKGSISHVGIYVGDGRYVHASSVAGRVIEGEPLLQLDAAAVDALHARGFEVAVETNGTQEPPRGVDWLCVSPKARAPLVLRRGNELKLVYPQPGLDPASLEQLEFDEFFLQPMDGPERDENTRKAVAYCLAHPRWRLSVQTHKGLGIR